jgi:hypothetical protein
VVNSNYNLLKTIFNSQTINSINNICISNTIMSLLDFNSTVEYILGKMNLITDSLSRKLVWRQKSEKDTKEDFTLAG